MSAPTLPKTGSYILPLFPGLEPDTENMTSWSQQIRIFLLTVIYERELFYFFSLMQNNVF